MKTKKILALALAAVLLVAVSVAGTIAYLTATSAPVENTFKVSGLSVDIEETTGEEYQVIPGVPITKDPEVTYHTNVDSYVFIKVEEVSWNDGLEYTIDGDVWTQVPGETDVWYHVVDIDEEAADYVLASYVDGTLNVITGDTITVQGTINFTQEAQLIITPYICQKEPINDPAQAWATYLNSGN